MTAAAPLAVVTVARDDLGGLVATADSVWSQAPHPPLWIVVDGGSRDGTGDWLRSHTDRVGWWRSAPDRGIYHAMNLGLAVARTRARSVLFLNAGDRFAHPGTASRLAEAFLADSEIDFIYGDAVEEGRFGRFGLKPARSHRWAALGMFAHHQSMAYRLREEFDIVFDERFVVGSDYAFTLEALASARKIEKLREVVAVVAPPGFSASHAELGRSDQFRIREEVLGMSFFARALVRMAQNAAQLARELAPETYFSLRFRDAETGLRNSPSLRDRKTRR